MNQDLSEVSNMNQCPQHAAQEPFAWIDPSVVMSKTRRLEILREYIAERSTSYSAPDMRCEDNILKVIKRAVDEYAGYYKAAPQHAAQQEREQHTPEPWGVVKGIHIVSGEKQIARTWVHDRPVSEAHSNARRIVACVNACAGMSNEHLEYVASVKDYPSYEQIKKQRDDMLAELEFQRDRNYNPFEPDNQCNNYKRLCAAIDSVTCPQSMDNGQANLEDSEKSSDGGA